MTGLKCTVHNCRHNKESLCMLESIEIGGCRAKTAGETSCDSFSEKSTDSYSNTMRDASEHARVQCEAEECVHNEACECHAGCISVEGSCACGRDGTECATFKCKNC